MNPISVKLKIANKIPTQFKLNILLLGLLFSHL